MVRLSGRRRTRNASASSPDRSTSRRTFVALAVALTVLVTMSIVDTRDAAAVWMQGSLITRQMDYLPQSTDTATDNAQSVAVAPAFGLAFEQSMGFFDDISNDLWISYYQDRARKAEHYRWSKTPNKGAVRTHHWNFFNWDP
jgi:hypothetical protein